MTTGSVPTPQGTQGGPAVQDHPRWPGYLASLTRNGYFKDSIQGSAQYKELLTEAAQAFMEAQPEQQSAGAGPTPAQSITAILEQPARPELYKVTLPYTCTVGKLLCVIQYLASMVLPVLVAVCML